MPVEVATPADLEDLEHKAAQAFQDMDQRLQALECTKPSRNITTTCCPARSVQMRPTRLPPERKGK